MFSVNMANLSQLGAIAINTLGSFEILEEEYVVYGQHTVQLYGVTTTVLQ